ncbi:MAG: GIY-YIG nuclease family protein [Candidatus Aenigmatarchaeota archaeon]
MRFSYIIVAKVMKNFSTRVGKLDNIHFNKGFYLYVGSAFYENGFSRILRHISKKKKKHWHIDYFLSSRKVKIVYIEIFPERRIECILASMIERFSDNSVKNFGCSDCFCKSHMFFFKNKNKVEDILRKIMIKILV